MAEPTPSEIAAVLWDLARRRGPDRSFCPSEAARALATDWRPLMPQIRAVARAQGLRATQKGVAVDAATARGPIRLSLPPAPVEPPGKVAQTGPMDWKPAGYTSLAPYLIVPDPEAVLQFCETVFGAERLRVIRDGDRIAHAEVRIDDTVLMMGGAEGPPAHLHLYLPDPDAALARALEAGATLVQPLQEQGDGDRRGAVASPDGTTWWLSRQL